MNSKLSLSPINLLTTDKKKQKPAPRRTFRLDWEDDVWQYLPDAEQDSDDGWSDFTHGNILGSMATVLLPSGWFNMSPRVVKPQDLPMNGYDLLTQCLKAYSDYIEIIAFNQMLLNHLGRIVVSNETMLNIDCEIKTIYPAIAAEYSHECTLEQLYGLVGLAAFMRAHERFTGNIFESNSAASTAEHCSADASSGQPVESAYAFGNLARTRAALYARGWHYHKQAKVWVEPFPGKVEIKNRIIRGIFFYYDVRFCTILNRFYKIKLPEYKAASAKARRSAESNGLPNEKWKN